MTKNGENHPRKAKLATAITCQGPSLSSMPSEYQFLTNSFPSLSLVRNYIFSCFFQAIRQRLIVRIVESGFRAGARLVVVVVTNKDHPAQYPGSIFTADNLQIPPGKERLTRRFACGLWEHEEFQSRSDEAAAIPLGYNLAL